MMTFQVRPAFIAGVVGGAVMYWMRLVVKKLLGVELEMDMAHMWGSMLGLRGAPRRMVGLAVHLVVSGAIAVIYAFGFAALRARNNLWLWGAGGGVVHWIIGGLFLGIVPVVHPEVPEERPAPGVFAKNFGRPDIPAFLIGHLLYGVLVAIVYALLSGRRRVGSVSK